MKTARRDQSYSISSDGCVIKLRGVTTMEEKLVVREAAEHIAWAVKIAEPQVLLMMHWNPGGELRIMISANADELAVFKGGSMHRKAIGKVRTAASVAMPHGGWWERLGKVEAKPNCLACMCGLTTGETAAGDDGLERCVNCGCH
jgi:hypothetical protein